VLLACNERGIAVPHDLSLTGFDDIDVAHYVSPPLTTVAQPRVAMGRRAMELLLDLLDSRPCNDHTFAPALVIRGSTGPSRQQR